MNVLLISANREDINMLSLPMGLACVAAAVEKAGHAVRFLLAVKAIDVSILPGAADIHRKCLRLDMLQPPPHWLGREPWPLFSDRVDMFLAAVVGQASGGITQRHQYLNIEHQVMDSAQH